MDGEQVIHPESAVLERNCRAIAARQPTLAQQIAGAASRSDLSLVRTAEAGAAGGGLTGGEDEFGFSVVNTGPAITLASRRRPLTEAARLAETIDPKAAGVVVTLGFGLGHHLSALIDRMAGQGVVLCFEPDRSLLRAVLERVDLSERFASGRLRLVTEATAPAVHDALSGVEGFAAIGVKIVEHPPSRALLGDSGAAFSRVLAEAVRDLRTTVATTLVQSFTTLRNSCMNAAAYAGSPGIIELRGVCAGATAVCVAAGPSLARNARLLASPGVRDRVVIIAAQTALKPLLAMGVRPHIVTALDYHEISRRFYEGLTEDDTRGVVLVAEPKANPGIVEAWPGAVVFTGAEPLDRVLNQTQAPREMGAVPPGATVAHLSYSVARYLGCDPVALVGQDLGFTDHLYYGDGAAIHEVWACELSGFRSLETLEWERIARHARQLRRRRGHRGELFVDDQMSNYLAQFEQRFAEDARAGLRVIDATEGGVVKAHAERGVLADVLAAAQGGHGLSERLETLSSADRGAAAGPRARAAEALAEAAEDCAVYARDAEDARALLATLPDPESNPQRFNTLVRQVHAVRDRAETRGLAPYLAQFVNQAGVLNRAKADRAIAIDRPGEAERARRQITRDAENLASLRDRSRELADMLRTARDAAAGRAASLRADIEAEPDRDAVRGVAAIIPVWHERCGLDTPRDLAAQVALGRNALQLTVERLLTCDLLGRVILLTDDEPRTRRVLGQALANSTRVRIEHSVLPADRRRAVGRARLFSPWAWRGGVANLTCYDELLDPQLFQRVMTRGGVRSCVLAGADWALIDPRLTDACIRRHLNQPEAAPVAFTQAPPGLCGAVLSMEAVQNLARAAEMRSPLATVGGLLGYTPRAPQADPIGKLACVQIEPAIRDLQRRCVPDSEPRVVQLGTVLADLGLQATADQIAGRLHAGLAAATGGPQQVTLELCSGRLATGVWGGWVRGTAEPEERGPVQAARARKLFSALAAARADVALTLHGAGDPLLHPELPAIIDAARETGIGAVHVRTDLQSPLYDAQRLVSLGVDVISVDLLAHTAEAYRDLTGRDGLAGAESRVLEMLDHRQEDPGELPSPWIVPRITRCARVLGELEPFYTRWIDEAGAAAIDPIPLRGTDDREQLLAGERFRPLTLPAQVRDREARTSMVVLADGTVPGLPGVNAFDTAVPDLWRTLWRRRRAGLPRRPSRRAPTPQEALA